MPLNHRIFRAPSRLAALLVMAGLCGCSTASQVPADAPSADDESTALGRRINMCAIQRARLDKARNELARFHRRLETLLQLDAEPGSSTVKYMHGTGRWALDWDPERIRDVEVRLDPDGFRVSATMPTLEDAREFIRRVRTLMIPHWPALASLSPTDGGAFHVVLIERAMLDPVLRGVEFGPGLFPERGEKSLAEYADEVCSFGRDVSPTLPEQLPGWTVEGIPQTTKGAWKVAGLRASAKYEAEGGRAQLSTLLDDAEEFDGIAFKLEGDQMVVDLYHAHPPEVVDTSALAAASNHDDRLGPAPRAHANPWHFEEGLPAGVSRAHLGSTSNYRYRRVRRLYNRVIDDYQRLRRLDDLLLRRARALRGLLCTTRAYLEPFEASGAQSKRELEVARLSFAAPKDGVVDGIEIEHIAVDPAGALSWRLAAKPQGAADSFRSTLDTCLGAQDFERADDAKGASHIAGNATPSSTGFLTPLTPSTAPPTFVTGEAFLRHIDRNYNEFQQALYDYRNAHLDPARTPSKNLVIGRNKQALSAAEVVVEQLVAFDVELVELAQRDVEPQRWTPFEPLRLDLEVVGAPTDVLGVATQLFDADKVFAPGAIDIAPSGQSSDQLRLRATIYALSET